MESSDKVGDDIGLCCFLGELSTQEGINEREIFRSVATVLASIDNSLYHLVKNFFVYRETDTMSLWTFRQM